MQTIVKKSTGKYIITGEHSVVYGEPALVASLDKTLTATLHSDDSHNALSAKRMSAYQKYIYTVFLEKFAQKHSLNPLDLEKISIHITSQIPQKSGLGSSAAYACAVLQVLLEYFSITVTQKQLYELVFSCEVFVHKNPSGIDPCAVVYKGLHRFQKNLELQTFQKTALQLPKKYTFLLINSGSATETTGEMVGSVAQLHKTDPEITQVIKKIGKVSAAIESQLKQGTFDGSLLSENQILLEQLGVVGAHAREMITEITKLGVGAKITGAGGIQTGSGWILVYNNDLETVEKVCKTRGWEYFTTTI